MNSIAFPNGIIQCKYERIHDLLPNKHFLIIDVQIDQILELDIGKKLQNFKGKIYKVFYSKKTSLISPESFLKYATASM